MKKLLIALTIFIATGCGLQRLAPVTIGMTEEQFKLEHKQSLVVEMSAYRTVYKDWDRSPISRVDTIDKFYYFSKGKLTLMDEGFFPKGAKAPVPTPM
ncbi:hypothetical protein IM792_05490 [Mucilaginibacter sp. JRF]|uniref:hypothetical protein n=1 Tax=Mucilaginibacter sp. JRF TaxID=2780088 RepID=UPI00188226D0|nr:hypothetical protein [Mucilaginibacter sp. JRF]MBE9583893.1 hypothetical protein [Mucilaginibacter sp. JRF]